MYFAAKYWRRTRTLELLEIDFFSGSRENDEKDEEPKSRIRRMLHALA